jgi:MoaA/NifB/PqqE/SkfB family radical SAM enzyme
MKSLSIHLTDMCNSRCSFCVVSSPMFSHEAVDFRKVVGFLEDNRDRGYEIVNLHGGEPTTHPKFLAVLELIQRLGYREVHLQTNGIKLEDMEFTRLLIELHVTKFIVSLHGSRAAVQDAQTVTPGGFDKTIRGIGNVKERGQHVRTNTVVTNQNLADLENISKLACSLSVDHLNFSNLHPVGSAKFSREKMMPKLRDVMPKLGSAVKLVIQSGRRVTLEGYPYCVLEKGMRKLHLNEETRDIKMLMRGDVIENYDSFMSRDMRILGACCLKCPKQDQCGGVYPEYVDYFGWEEFSAIGEPSSRSFRRKSRESFFSVDLG